MLVILFIIIAMFIILFTWSWHCLEDIEKYEKIISIIIGTLIVYVITFIIFNISKSGINYENINNAKQMKMVYILMFTALNGYILLPFIYKKMAQVNSNEITKEKLAKSLIILLIIFIIVSIFEINYLKILQESFVQLNIKAEDLNDTKT